MYLSISRYEIERRLRDCAHDLFIVPMISEKLGTIQLFQPLILTYDH